MIAVLICTLFSVVMLGTLLGGITYAIARSRHRVVAALSYAAPIAIGAPAFSAQLA